MWHFTKKPGMAGQDGMGAEKTPKAGDIKKRAKARLAI